MQYKQLTKEERYYIECRKANNIYIGVRTLAREMGRSPSTISRELRRNFDTEFDFYSGIRAQSIYLGRRRQVAKKRINKISELVKSAQFYFANPYHSWERGLNEHQNGLIRDFMPKKTDFRNIDVDMIRYVENNLNNRPRKALDFLTPAEDMFNYVNFGVLHLN